MYIFSIYIPTPSGGMGHTSWFPSRKGEMGDDVGRVIKGMPAWQSMRSRDKASPSGILNTPGHCLSSFVYSCHTEIGSWNKQKKHTHIFFSTYYTQIIVINWIRGNQLNILKKCKKKKIFKILLFTLTGGV